MRWYTMLIQALLLVRPLATTGTRLFLVMLITYSSIVSVRSALAVPGELLARIEVPRGGIGLALVPGLVLGLDNSILLATGSSSAIDFLDPTTNPGTLVRTITPNVIPTPAGWQGLALFGTNSLLACTPRFEGRLPARVGFDRIYLIDINPSNDIPDGTTWFLFERSAGGECAIAWDPQDGTIWRATSAISVVERLGMDGSVLERVFDLGGTTPRAIALLPLGDPSRPIGDLFRSFGDSLFVSVRNNIQQIDKTTGCTIRTLVINEITGGNPPVSPVEGLACDDRTFVSARAARHRDAIWAMVLGQRRLFAFELPLGTCLAGRFRYPDGNSVSPIFLAFQVGICEAKMSALLSSPAESMLV